MSRTEFIPFDDVNGENSMIKADQKEAVEKLRNIGQTRTDTDDTTPPTALPEDAKKQTP